MLLSEVFPVAHVANPRALRDAPYGERQRRILNRAAGEAARREISAWPGYAPTPCVNLAGLAREAGLGSIWYKDESQRFGLGSFKALGGAYAVFRLLADIVRRHAGVEVTARDLVDGRHRRYTGPVTVTCATDGNHGRSVAWGARTFGCECVIYIHATVSEARKLAIERYQARVVRIQGNYDDAVRQAARDAAANGWLIVSDTSYEGYTEVPKDVMQGYTVMVSEALDQIPRNAGLSHVFVQGGVGGLAAAVCAETWEALGPSRPRVVVVEPDRAACLFESARAGEIRTVGGALDTVMAGLACGEPSLLAWEILQEGAEDFLTVVDAAAVECMRLLARGRVGDPPLVAGESAVAGLAGLLSALQCPGVAHALGLGRTSGVLLVGSEGDTDPELYARLVGCTAEQVRGGRCA